jgi:hypothetical protein
MLSGAFHAVCRLLLTSKWSCFCRLVSCRDKEHSTIIFEGPADTPLLRLGWNKQDPRYIATLVADSPKVRPSSFLKSTRY